MCDRPRMVRQFDSITLVLLLITLMSLGGCASHPIATYRDPNIDGDNYAQLDLMPEGFRFRRFAIYRLTPKGAEPIDVAPIAWDWRPIDADGIWVMHLRPGRYLLDFWASFPHKHFLDDLVGATVYGALELKAGSKYRFRGKFCSLRCGGEWFHPVVATWVENEETGEVVLGESKFPYED